MNRDMNLGVCYYPEHWPEENWQDDATRMHDLGISFVRVGEFAWSRIEPEPGAFDWDWLDRSINVLGDAGLSVILGTPTATPPKWLIDKHPDILARSENGLIRKFGSRRHYCFSSTAYRREAARITMAVAERYGNSPVIYGWQTDNEYGCHDTTRSYSAEAEAAFRLWLKDKYSDIANLNSAWGTVFWSQEYSDFNQVDLPNATVTEATPSHLLDFYRFSSDQVVGFNRMKCDILRRLSPDKPITHNFMGLYAGFDHFKVSEDLDFASWDSYPLGFLDVGPFSEDDKLTYMRQGHPDLAAFHHDLYRACGRGRWWVMEQQPGPVNWAHHNPCPLPGMVRTWSWEAFAHAAETVSYFRWRQAPFAQEQFHAGLNRVDGAEAAAASEIRQVAEEIGKVSAQTREPATIALLFSYEAKWVYDIQPQGAAWFYWRIVLEWYQAARQLGLDLDIVHAGSDLSPYQIILVPSLPIIPDRFLGNLAQSSAHVLFGPRSGSKTENFQVPATLAPGPLQDLIPIKITHSESFRAGYLIDGVMENETVQAHTWLDHVETELVPKAQTPDGLGLLYEHHTVSLLTTVPDRRFLHSILVDLAQRQNLCTTQLQDGLRIRRKGDVVFAFNYGPTRATVPENIRPARGAPLLGQWEVEAGGLCCWESK